MKKILFKTPTIPDIPGKIKGIPFVKQYDKRIEADRQMLLRVSIKFVTLIIIVVMFDTLLDWSLGLLDLAIHLIHLSVEAIEYTVGALLTYTLGTNHKQGEMIMVNAVIIIALFLAYRLMRAIPRLYRRFIRQCRVAWLRQVRHETSCWRAMSLIHKIKWLGANILGTASLFLFLG